MSGEAEATGSASQTAGAPPLRPTLRVLGIAGSLRAESFNRRLLMAAGQEAPEGMTIDVYDRLGEVPLFNADLESEGGVEDPDGVRALRAAVARSDAVLIATPEYNRGVPGVVKNALDWLSRRHHGTLRGMPVGIVGATTGRWGTRVAQTLLAQMISDVGGLHLVGANFLLAGAGQAFEGDGLDSGDLDRLRTYLESLDEWTRLVGGGRTR